MYFREVYFLIFCSFLLAIIHASEEQIYKFGETKNIRYE